jgi:CHASE2 domain-containing sensor protein
VSPGVVGVIEKRVRLSCYLALAALALIVWSLVHPAPLPVIGAMSVGQLLGTLSLGFFLHAIVADLRPALATLRVRAMKTAAATEPEPEAKDERKVG